MTRAKSREDSVGVHHGHRSNGAPSPPTKRSNLADIVRGKNLTLRQREKGLAFVLITPPLLIVIGLLAYPMYLAIDMSLREGALIDLAALREQAYTLANYTEILRDSGTWRSVWISLVYTIGATAPAFGIGLGTALLLNGKFPGRKLLRPFVLLPWPIPGVAISVIFLWLMDSSYGVVNSILRQVGVIDQNVGWFTSADTAMIAVIVPTTWKYYPFFTLVILAALQSVPHDLYEAARVDGAGKLREFFYITWPAIRSPAMLSLVIGGLGIFREFDVIFPLTGGGPLGATETLPIKLYNEAFRYHNLPEASALGILAIIIIGAAAWYAIRQMRREFF